MKHSSFLVATSMVAFAAPAIAQTVDHSNMPGMNMPPKPVAKPKPTAAPPVRPTPKPATNAAEPNPVSAADPDCLPEHAAMGHCTPADAPSENQRLGGAQDPKPAAADPHAGHDMATMPAGKPTAHGTGGTALPPGDAPAPAAPEPNYADSIWDAGAMQEARDNLRREHGGGTFTQVMLNLAEVQIREGRDGYRWEGEGWYGGDLNRIVLKSEGSGGFGEGVDDAEVQLLYSRTVGPYFNLQAGIRYDIEPNPSRAYATVGFEGLAPYWFEVEGALFLSNKGDVLARFEGYYDQRITQRLILQPRLETNFALQDVRENGIGSGLSDIELGLRLRYEIKRELAPYIGISYDRKIGDTARFARLDGEDVGATSLVLGLRVWF